MGLVIAKIQKDPLNKVPLREKVLLGSLFFTTVFATSTSLFYVSYPLHLLARNIRLLSIFIVGVFFSRLRATGKGSTLGKQKLVIGLVITVGVLLFSLAKVKNTIMKPSNNVSEKESSWPGYLLLLTATLADGFFLDSQAYSKKKFKPSSNELFMATNGIACVIAVLYSSFVG